MSICYAGAQGLFLAPLVEYGCMRSLTAPRCWFLVTLTAPLVADVRGTLSLCITFFSWVMKKKVTDSLFSWSLGSLGFLLWLLCVAQVLPLERLTRSSFELHAVTVTLPIKLYIAVIYHLPGPLRNFFDEMDAFLTSPHSLCLTFTLLLSPPPSSLLLTLSSPAVT